MKDLSQRNSLFQTYPINILCIDGSMHSSSNMMGGQTETLDMWDYFPFEVEAQQNVHWPWPFADIMACYKTSAHSVPLEQTEDSYLKRLLIKSQMAAI